MPACPAGSNVFKLDRVGSEGFPRLACPTGKQVSSHADSDLHNTVHQSCVPSALHLDGLANRGNVVSSRTRPPTVHATRSRLAIGQHPAHRHELEYVMLEVNLVFINRAYIRTAWASEHISAGRASPRIPSPHFGVDLGIISELDVRTPLVLVSCDDEGFHIVSKRGCRLRRWSPQTQPRRPSRPKFRIFGR